VNPFSPLLRGSAAVITVLVELIREGSPPIVKLPGVAILFYSLEEGQLAPVPCPDEPAHHTLIVLINTLIYARIKHVSECRIRGNSERDHSFR
jgi:hypothetical protein